MTRKTLIHDFSIAAVGASAGGLEAYSSLLEHLPLDTGIGYVFIIHLDPNHTSILAKLLSKKTKIPITQAKEDMLIEPNHVYINPPANDIIIQKGKLKLIPRITFDGTHMPIDYFMRSLAVDQKNKSIGIVLSGTASDGALGLQAIKAEGGIIIAQDEDSAKYSGMPHAATTAGSVDFILSPENIASELAQIGKRTYITTRSPKTKEDGRHIFSPDENELTKIFAILRSTTGVDFSHYKRSTLLRRMQRRMIVVNTKQLTDYVAYLNQHPEEVLCLQHDILITVTRFFRDPQTLEELKRSVFPKLIKDRVRGSTIRIWIAGCSSGEEVYTIAILLLEFLEENKLPFPIQLFGSDISDSQITKARKGSFIENIAMDISPERLNRYFMKEGGFYRVQKFVRDLCIFARQDLTTDPPFSKLDLISCRNVLIYMEKELQEKIMLMFHFALNPNGFLVLGLAETVGLFTNLFEIIDKKNNFYMAKQAPRQMHISLAARNYESRTQERMSGIQDEPPGKYRKERLRNMTSSPQNEADRLLLTNYTPASVLIDEDMDIMQFRGQTNLFLQPASGKASFNLLKMAKEGLVVELTSTIRKAAKQGVPVASSEFDMTLNDNTDARVTLEVTPIITSDSKERYFLILFNPRISEVPSTLKGDIDSSKQTSSARTLTRLRQELATTKEYLQSLIEDREAANEELKASNEEILSSNEELQSTNEELETAKEELQSINEELNTVNDELQARNIELGESADYAQSIVKTIREPLIVMGRDLRVKSANQAFYKMFDALPSETEGKLIYELGNGQWNNPVLRRYLEQILPQNNEFQDFEIEYMFPKIGRKIMLLNALRLLQKDKKEALILLAIEDITERKLHQHVLRASENKYRAIFEYSNDAIFVIDPIHLKVIDYNPQAENMLGYSKEEMENLLLPTVFVEDLQKFKSFVTSVMQKGKGWSNDFNFFTKNQCPPAN